MQQVKMVCRGTLCAMVSQHDTAAQQRHNALHHSTKQQGLLDCYYVFSAMWQLVQAFKDGDIRFLICTDVAARGIDIAGLPYVINMTLPDRSEHYIHRVGRVGELPCLHTHILTMCYDSPLFFSATNAISLYGCLG